MPVRGADLGTALLEQRERGLFVTGRAPHILHRRKSDDIVEIATERGTLRHRPSSLPPPPTPPPK